MGEPKEKGEKYNKLKKIRTAKEQHRARNKEHHKSERSRVVIRKGIELEEQKEQTQQMSKGKEKNLEQLIE